MLRNDGCSSLESGPEESRVSYGNYTVVSKTPPTMVEEDQNVRSVDVKRKESAIIEIVVDVSVPEL